MTCTIVSTGEEIQFNEQETKALKERISVFILNLRKENITELYTNCERGIPLWSALVAVLVGIKVHLIIPYEEQAADWSEEDRDYYYMAHARRETTVTFASKRYYKGCYAAADKIMAEHSDRVIVFGSAHPISVIAKEKTEFVPFF